MTPPRPRDMSEFSVALICALPVEVDAVHSLFDVFWDDSVTLGVADSDENQYSLGAIGEHNIVLAHMSAYGSVHAAVVAANLNASFPNIKLAVVVGVCGGVPTKGNNRSRIYLGDLIISTRILQYDLGKQYQATFERLDITGQGPTMDIRNLFGKLQSERERLKFQCQIDAFLEELATKCPGAQMVISHDQEAIYLCNGTSWIVLSPPTLPPPS